jgi:prepilin signal peptidase PulO-like enzyme (type II secretory pathway)
VRSRCACGRELGILEVVPVLSWVVLRGRSKCCKVRLPARWPLEELFTGIAFYIGGHLVPLWGVVLSVGALGVVGVIEIYSQAREASFAGGPVLADASEPRRLEI